MKRKRSINAKVLTGFIIVLILALSFVGTKIFQGSDNAVEKADLRSTTQSVPSDMIVRFIDVGQGNCSLITLGDQAILVDAGEVGTAQKTINYIKNLGVDELDCVIVTHPHSDHMGALTKILYEFKIKDLIMPEIPEKIIPTTKTYERFLTAVSDNADNVIPAKAGSTYSYGEMKLEIFAPLHDYDDLNDMSVVSRISYGETSVMFTGDATNEVEKDLLNQKKNYSADLLNVGHHGSKTSSSLKWLKTVNPQYAVICCGSGNDYGHPHKVVTDRLDKLSIKYFRTDLLGTIVFSSNSKEFRKCD